MVDVNFSGALEAVHADGQFCCADLTLVRSDGNYLVSWLFNGERYEGAFRRDGAPVALWPWTIRNTAKPSTPSNEELTQRVEITGDTLVMLRRVLGVALHDPGVTHEAEKLLGILPKPVDPIDRDRVLARSIADERCQLSPDAAYRDIEMAAFEGIKLGRTLAAGGAAHE